MSLIQQVEVTGFELSNPYVNWRIPIACFTYTRGSELESKLVRTINNIEKLYSISKPDSINNGDGGTSTKNILTSNFMNYNILDDLKCPLIVDLKKFIGECYTHYLHDVVKDSNPDMTYITTACWANKLEQYDYLSAHTHMKLTSGVESTDVSGHYFIRGGKIPTSTTYSSPAYTDNRHDDSLSITNTPGTLTLFPMFVRHKTSANRNSEHRYSLGMDIKRNCYEKTRVSTGEYRPCLVRLFEEDNT